MNVAHVQLVEHLVHLRRCKEVCPHEIVPLKKRQVYAKCGGMIPGYGGHVPGYSVCTLGNSYR